MQPKSKTGLRAIIKSRAPKRTAVLPQSTFTSGAVSGMVRVYRNGIQMSARWAQKKLLRKRRKINAGKKLGREQWEQMCGFWWGYSLVCHCNTQVTLGLGTYLTKHEILSSSSALPMIPLYPQGICSRAPWGYKNPQILESQRWRYCHKYMYFYILLKNVGGMYSRQFLPHNIQLALILLSKLEKEEIQCLQFHNGGN